MFVFRADTNRASVETITRNEGTGEYAYIKIDWDGEVTSEVFRYMGLVTVQCWKDTQNFIDGIRDEDEV